MKLIHNCSYENLSKQVLIKKRNALAGVGIGIVAGYTFLVALFLGTVKDIQMENLILTLLGLVCMIVSITLILGTEWRKINRIIQEQN